MTCSKVDPIVVINLLPDSLPLEDVAVVGGLHA